jgi:acyl dehydratase
MQLRKLSGSTILPQDAAVWTFEEILEGQEFGFEVTVAGHDIDDFGKLSGDVNPLHMNEEFAKSRGFERRVVHGAYMVGLVSRLLGMNLPGLNCLIHEIRIKFPRPAYVGDRLFVKGIVDQRSEAARAITMSVTISARSSTELVASGKATVGFTSTRS